MLNRSASLAMSTSFLKALPGKLDIKRHSPSIFYISFQQRQLKPFLLKRHNALCGFQVAIFRLSAVVCPTVPVITLAIPDAKLETISIAPFMETGMAKTKLADVLVSVFYEHEKPRKLLKR